MTVFVNFTRGMQRGSGNLLPLFHIGSSRNETSGANVLRRPSRHKQNQQLMNDWQSTSISRKLLSENPWGEGEEPSR